LSSTMMSGRTKVWRIARWLRPIGPDWVGQLGQCYSGVPWQQCHFATEDLSLSLSGQTGGRGQQLRPTIRHGSCVSGIDDTASCPNHFAICAALGSLSSVALSSAQTIGSSSDPSDFCQFVVLTLRPSI
jgi:hypothetical protein